MSGGPAAARERELYELGRAVLEAGGRLPHGAPDELAHVVRGIWDRAGYVGRNVGGYPVASLVAPPPLAHDIAAVIGAVTGRRSPARPIAGGLWVGASGRACAAWLAYLYGGATVASPTKLAAVRELLADPQDARRAAS